MASHAVYTASQSFDVQQLWQYSVLSKVQINNSSQWWESSKELENLLKRVVLGARDTGKV